MINRSILLSFLTVVLMASLFSGKALATAASIQTTSAHQSAGSSDSITDALRRLKSIQVQHLNNGEDYLASKAAVDIAELYQQLGNFTEAAIHFREASRLAVKYGDKEWIAVTLDRAGNAFALIGSYAEAEDMLQEAMSAARGPGNAQLEAVISNDLGNLFLLQKQYQKARLSYKHSSAIASQTNNSELLGRSMLNIAILELEEGKYANAEVHLRNLMDQLNKLPATSDIAYLHIKVASAYSSLADLAPDNRGRYIKPSYHALERAKQVADTKSDWRLTSYVYGMMGELYEHSGRYEEAIALTRKAIFATQQGYAPEVMYRWHWQAARIFKAKGEVQNALSAYRNAAANLQTVRNELTASYNGTQHTFRESVRPVFLEFADLLLTLGNEHPDPVQGQLLYREARETVELLKAAEIQDYFKDDCVAAARARIKDIEEALSDRTAVIYPILLPDRIELLVSFSDKLVKYSTPVALEAVKQQVADFRAKLEKRTTRQFLRPARKLYSWLMQPMEQELRSRGIDTLVFVPDSVLRNIPLAALHDGKVYLIEHYALATTPGLDLTDPRPLQRENINLLLNGLTDAVQGFPALIHVPHEIESIRKLYGGKTLFNEDFRLSTLAQQLNENAYSVIHIASHGKFAGTVKDSFLLTHDEKLTMNDLEHYIGQSKYRLDKPIELLTLSACETAAGDDQSGLGLASVAIKAGARSALATLWSIDDKSTSMLVIEFYRQLKDPDNTKARALQQAQLKTLADLRYRHPGYWAPFLLIGNWL